MATVRGGKDFSTVLAVGSVGPVAPATETTVASYTAVGNRRIAQVQCSGDVRAKWILYVDGSPIGTKRGGDRNVEFDYDWPIRIDDGQVLDVKVTHYKSLETPSFDASILGL